MHRQTRRASLSLLTKASSAGQESTTSSANLSLQLGAHGVGQDAALVDARYLEEWCSAGLARCIEHEQTVSQLQIAIDASVKEWESAIASLKSLDQKAASLDEQIRISARALRQSTMEQTSSVKNSALKVQTRVKQSGDRLEEAKASIELAHISMSALEERMGREEGILGKIDSLSKFLMYLSIFAAIIFAVLVGWVLSRR